MLLLLMMIIIMNYFCDMIDRQKAFSFIQSQDHCQRSSPSQISNKSQEESKFFEFQTPVICLFSIYLSSAINSAILILSSSALLSLEDLLLNLSFNLLLKRADLLLDDYIIVTVRLELSCLCLSISVHFIQLCILCLDERMLWSKSSNHSSSLSCSGANNKKIYGF